MYATQTTLVEQESYTFHKLGFDVYTAAWATNQTTHLNRYREYNPKHFYQGKCDFLTDEETGTLSKIDVDWSKLPHRQVDYYEDVQTLLLDKFDVLYVTAPTPWLVYAKKFLEAGKIVIFRPFGYHPNTWGVVDLGPLFAYDKFFVCTCTPVDQIYYPRSYCITTMMNDELFLEVGEPCTGSGAFTVSAGIDHHVFGNINEQLAIHGIPWATRQYYYKGPWLNQAGMDALYSNSLIFLDLNHIFKYPLLEAIAHGKVVVANSVIKSGPLYKYLAGSGLVCNDFWFDDENYKDVGDVVAKLYKDDELKLQVFEKQNDWLNNIMTVGISTWCRILEVDNE